jgi:hypothetical protein
MPINGIPRKLSDCHPKRREKEREFGDQTDRRINLFNPKTKTDQNGLTLVDDGDSVAAAAADDDDDNDDDLTTRY